MESLSRLNHHRPQHPLHLSLNHHRPSFSTPITSISFKALPQSTLSRSLSIKSSSSSSMDPRHTQNPHPPILKTLIITAVAASALFFNRFATKLAVAAPIAPPATAETESETTQDEEKERTIEEYLNSHPDDVPSLRSLMEAKIKNRKFNEAIEVLDRLIQLEPGEHEWPLLKAHLHSYNGDSESAKLEFETILENDPLRVEAYHGLVMAVSQSESESDTELRELLKRIQLAMDKCKKEKKKDDLRDFKLLVAQICVIKGDYTDALKVYQELVNEEPRDFRPYLCQGIIYTLLKKKDEAEKQFQKYRRLVPKGHPYARYFDENMMATKVFSQMAEGKRS